MTERDQAPVVSEEENLGLVLARLPRPERAPAIALALAAARERGHDAGRMVQFAIQAFGANDPPEPLVAAYERGKADERANAVKYLRDYYGDINTAVAATALAAGAHEEKQP